MTKRATTRTRASAAAAATDEDIEHTDATDLPEGAVSEVKRWLDGDMAECNFRAVREHLRDIMDAVDEGAEVRTKEGAVKSARGVIMDAIAFLDAAEGRNASGHQIKTLRAELPLVIGT